jgi:Flp pilus assembly protein TadB
MVSNQRRIARAEREARSEVERERRRRARARARRGSAVRELARRSLPVPARAVRPSAGRSRRAGTGRVIRAVGAVLAVNVLIWTIRDDLSARLTVGLVSLAALPLIFTLVPGRRPPR